MRQRSTFCLMGFVVMALACGPARSPEAGVPETMVLRVDVVQVSENHLDSSTPWDGPKPEPEAGAGCRVIAAGAMFFEPTLGKGVGAICGMAAPPQQERDAKHPDLALRLRAGAATIYETRTVPDAVSQVLSYEFVVPLAAVPGDGLQLDVIDDDTTNLELIGGIRLSRQQLVDAYQSPSKLVVLSGGAVVRLELVVSAYSGERTIKVTRAAKDPPIRVGRQVMAGEVVKVRASGSFRVGSWYGESLSPAGYPGGEARRYNLAPFKEEPHACAIALVGARPDIYGIAIREKATFVTAHAGALRVGLNDSDLDNNEGLVSFEVELRAPTVEEWLGGGEPHLAEN